MEPVTAVVAAAATLFPKAIRKDAGHTGTRPPVPADRPVTRLRRRYLDARAGAAATAVVADRPRIELQPLAGRSAIPAGLDLAGDTGRGVRRAVGAARQLLRVDTARLLLAEPDGQLRWATAVDLHGRIVADPHRSLADGPCLAAFTDGCLVGVNDVHADDRWASTRQQLVQAGISASLSIPIDSEPGRTPIGVLDLYRVEPRPWDDATIAAARAYGGVLSLLLTETLTAVAAGELADQLQRALDVRILVEQAKGALMAREGIGAQAAWERLRRPARNTQRRVDVVAHELLAEIEPPFEPVGTGSAAGGGPGSQRLAWSPQAGRGGGHGRYPSGS